MIASAGGLAGWGGPGQAAEARIHVAARLATAADRVRRPGRKTSRSEDITVHHGHPISSAGELQDPADPMSLPDKNVRATMSSRTWRVHLRIMDERGTVLGALRPYPG